MQEPTPLDVLVVAPHPDDAELGMAGAILQYKADGYRVGVLDLTDGEPTPFGSLEIRARETAAATKILGLDWRGNLGLPNRSLRSHARSPAAAGRRVSPAQAAAAVRALLGRRPSRPRGRRRTDRSGPLLVEAHQDRPAGRAASSGADPVLQLRASAGRRKAGLRARHQPLRGRRSWRPSNAIAASSSRAGPTEPPTFLDRLARPGGLLGLVDRRGLRRSLLPAASRWGWPACATWSERLAARRDSRCVASDIASKLVCAAFGCAACGFFRRIRRFHGRARSCTRSRRCILRSAAAAIASAVRGPTFSPRFAGSLALVLSPAARPLYLLPLLRMLRRGRRIACRQATSKHESCGAGQTADK